MLLSYLRSKKRFQELDVSCIEFEGHRDSHVRVLREESMAEIAKKQRESCFAGAKVQNIFHEPE